MTTTHSSLAYSPSGANLPPKQRWKASQQSKKEVTQNTETHPNRLNTTPQQSMRVPSSEKALNGNTEDQAQPANSEGNKQKTIHKTTHEDAEENQAKEESASTISIEPITKPISNTEDNINTDIANIIKSLYTHKPDTPNSSQRQDLHKKLTSRLEIIRDNVTKISDTSAYTRPIFKELAKQLGLSIKQIQLRELQKHNYFIRQGSLSGTTEPQNGQLPEHAVFLIKLLSIPASSEAINRFLIQQNFITAEQSTNAGKILSINRIIQNLSKKESTGMVNSQHRTILITTLREKLESILNTIKETASKQVYCLVQPRLFKKLNITTYGEFHRLVNQTNPFHENSCLWGGKSEKSREKLDQCKSFLIELMNTDSENMLTFLRKHKITALTNAT